MSEKKLLPKKSQDLSDWYTTIIRLAELADYGPSKGSMIIRPYGYAIWELAQAALDERFKNRGVQNAYFPLFIPMSFIQKEQSHVEGFAPELAIVTHGGGEELEEPLAVRPTSETIINDSFSKWVQSWRDLPVLLNQWCNVVRWEKRTLPFLRTSEFLWQEGHTIHATHEEAIAMKEWAMDTYQEVYEQCFALYGHRGNKSSSERFAGADDTLTMEHLMPSGKALQSCTSHDLGQNFAKAFGTKFQDKNGTESYVWQTSWGFSTRSLGGLILSHGDDNGLRLPPKLAPVQVVIIPVVPTGAQQEYAHHIAERLKEQGIRVHVDDRDDERFGYRINKWEVKGVPLRLEIGDREVDKKEVTVAVRWDGTKTAKPLDAFVADLNQQLDTIQQDMFDASKHMTQSRTHRETTYEGFKKAMSENKGFIEVFWNDDPEIEAKIKAETKATSRCCVGEGQGVDFYTGKPATKRWIFAHAY